MTGEGTAREPELTVRAIAIGTLLGGLLAAGNVYSGLKLGYVDTGATLYVLVSFALFAALGRPLSGRETNAAQVAGGSAASMAVTAGLVGPVPALAMLGQAPSSAWIAVWGAILAVFGTLLALPFRRQLIEDEALPFPSGRAAGELIKGLVARAGAGRGRVRALFAATTAAILVVAVRELWGTIPAELLLPLVVAGIPPTALHLGFMMSPLIAGVGLLVGLRVGLSILGGGVLAWLVIAPALDRRGAIDVSDFGSAISWLLWPGAALMVASSLASLAFGARELWRGWSRRRAELGGREWRWMRAGAVLCAAGLVAVGWLGFGVNPLISVAALVIAVVFSIVGMRASGETDQTPSGPLGGLSQVLIGATAPGSTVPTLFAGGVTNGASAHAATMMHAWKAGHLLGSAPGRLLAAQLLGVAVGVASSIAAYVLLDAAYGIGSEALPSPPAISWKATAEVVQGGISAMPAGAPMAALIGALVGVLLTALERWGGRVARFAPSPVALGIGFIVPLSMTGTIALVAVALAIFRRGRTEWTEHHVPSVAAGLIAGEAMAALVFAALVVAGLR
ncbi:MAG TPA: OPT family oligopeptide transporter [Kofleriaceae bacterium]|nr:OPT family oligopeptide transporter [Kofleriaceae bacterium]